ncbi:helix-turn-helix domain-containing protein [Sphingobium baderi]|nr:AraC family transcriptional regulator [Sphingobium baderi]
MNTILATRRDAQDAENRTNVPVCARTPKARQQTLPARHPVRPAIQRQRFKLGSLEFDYRAFPRQRSVTFASTDTMVHIVMPLSGFVEVESVSRQPLGPGSALLLAAGERKSMAWDAGSSALFLHIPRADIQVQASRASGEPRRLAAADHLFRWSIEQLGVKLPCAIIPGPGPRASFDDVLLEKRTLEGLVATLQADPEAETLFPVARSVQRAVEHIRAHPQQAWTIHALGQIAGVTAGTLRRNFRTCLGLTVIQLIQDIRVDWVRLRLESVNESRSISEIALAVGFGTPVGMSRAYQRRFGETPTQTRTRTFRATRG